jgi:hypothetical protein
MIVLSMPFFTIGCKILRLDGRNSLHIWKAAINSFESAAAGSRQVVMPLLGGWASC